MVLGFHLVLAGLDRLPALATAATSLQTISLGDALDSRDDPSSIINGLPHGATLGLHSECQLHVLVRLVELVLDDVGKRGLLSQDSREQEQQQTGDTQVCHRQQMLISDTHHQDSSSSNPYCPHSFLSILPQLSPIGVYRTAEQVAGLQELDILYLYLRKRHMAKVGKEKLQVLIGEMSHYDPDNMEMAAKRLSEIILAGELNLEGDEKVATQVREAYMKQIESENDTVQSEAIKYLADIVPKLPSSQVELIFEKILEFIVNQNLHEKKRERYGACAATVIHQAAEEHGHKLENLFLKSIGRLLEFKDKKSEIEIILIGIITEFLKKWPNVASQLKFDRPSLTTYLLKNVQVKSKLDIIKKSETCLGKLALILNKDHVQLLIADRDWGLLRFIENSRKKQGLDNLKHLRNGLLCLNQVIRTNNVELRWWVREAGQLLVGTIEQFRGWEDIELIEPVCDILDAALTALAYLIKTFSRELKDLLLPRENPFNAFILPLLAFDVEGMMSYAGEPMEIEEAGDEDQEYYEEAEVDEKCWKVRRAALYYVGVLAKYDHNLLERIGEGELVGQLGDKLVEEHAMVSEMAFATFNTLVELISIDRGLIAAQAQEQEISLQRVKSSALDVADNLIKEVTRRISIVLNNSKFNDQLKIESSKILLRIIQIYNHILINNEQEAFSLINFVLDELKKTGIVENKCNLLACLKELVSNDYPFEHYQRLWDYVFEQLARTSTVKVQTIGFAILRRINETFKEAVPANSKYYASLLSLLRGKIKEFDGDKSIKVAVLKCLGSFFAGLPVGEADAVFFLENLSAKLKIEVEKLPIVETLLRLRAGAVCSPQKAKVLETITKQVADNLGSNNYELNVKSIEAINQALAIVGGKFSQGTLTELLEKSKHLLNDGKIPLFFRPIVDSNPKILKPYSELIIRSTETYYIAKLITAGVIETSAVVKILKGLDLVEKGKRISLTLGNIGIAAAELLKEADDTNWGRLIVGALGYVGDENTLGPLFKLLEGLKVEENKYAVCAAIGNIVSRNQNNLVGKLMQAAGAVKDVYLYICIFKEMIGYNSQPFAQLPQLIEWLLTKSQDKFEAESNYFITSECVGKLAFITPEAAKLVISNSKSPIENRRLIVANSLRFGLQAQTTSDSLFLRDYIQAIVTLVGDQKVRVREGAVKSLIAVSQLQPKTLKEYSNNREFWKNVLFNSQINDSLISTIDYGLCKEVRDEGKSLRLESFNLLQILVARLSLQGPQIDEIMGSTLHRIAGETSNDIVLKRLTVLRSLCQLDYTPFLRLQEEFVRAVGTKEGVFKKYQTKAPEDERVEVFLRGVLQEINTLHQLLRQENIDRLAPLFVEYRSNPALAAILDSLNKAN